MTVQAVAARDEIGARTAVLAYLAVSGVVLLLMMLFGLTMRLAQAQWISLDPAVFYMLMTMHGAGMVGIAGLSGAAVMWHFVRRHVPVSTGVFLANLVFFLLGAVLILGSGFIGKFAAGWTFLFPLPAHSGDAWSANAAAAYLIGLLLIGVGFLLLHLDIARGILSVYGGLGAGLGARQAFGLAPEADGPPPAVAASTMVAIVNILGILFGTLCGVLGDELQRLAAARRGPRLLSISFDPEHDDRRALELYGERYGAALPRWRIAAPADQRSLRTLLQRFGVVATPDGSGGFVHNGALYLVDSRGCIARILDPSATPQMIAAADGAS